MSSDPRKLALTVLNQIDSSDLTLDGLVERLTPEGVFASHRDRALFNTLVYGTLRWRRKLDHILGHFVDRPLKKIEPGVLNVLRLGLYQIAFLDRIPHSAAVNTAVNLVRSIKASWAAGFVNAVLRRSSREYQQVSFSPDEDMAPESLAINKSYPDWLLKRWYSRYGADRTARLCDALNKPSCITLRVNTLKTGPDQLMPVIKDFSKGIEKTVFAPDGIRNFQATGTFFESRIFEDGLCAIQDEAAQLIGLLVDPQPGERILDGCAGLGGKSGHLAQLMRNTGEVIATDRSTAKLEKLKAEMQRLGISIVKPVALALEKAVSKEELKEPFDRILMDAPCSGLGVIRRNPDIKWSPLKQNLRRYQQTQSRLLDLAAPLVKPEGILVYAVCSNEPEETDQVVSGFLKNHPEFAISPGSDALAGKHFAPLFTESSLRTFPEHVDMDGFFGVRLRRIE